METRKFKQIPSISPMGRRNPLIPRPVIVSCGNTLSENERTITRAIRTDSRAVGVGGDINWDEIYG